MANNTCISLITSNTILETNMAGIPSIFWGRGSPKESHKWHIFLPTHQILPSMIVPCVRKHVDFNFYHISYRWWNIDIFVWLSVSRWKWLIVDCFDRRNVNLLEYFGILWIKFHVSYWDELVNFCLVGGESNHSYAIFNLHTEYCTH